VTERCVLRLTPGGLELAEVAPGVDIRRDILAHMDFLPIVKEPRPMDARILAEGTMGLREGLAEQRLEQRFSYDFRLNMLFIDFRNLPIRTERDVERIRAEVEKRVLPLGHRVNAIVNYRGSTIEPAVIESYCRMIDALQDSCYLNVTRYGAADVPRPPQDAAHDEAAALLEACATPWLAA
jgi:propionate CoA-transferase